jgi:hypothetical protein
MDRGFRPSAWSRRGRFRRRDLPPVSPGVLTGRRRLLIWFGSGADIPLTSRRCEAKPHWTAAWAACGKTRRLLSDALIAAIMRTGVAASETRRLHAGRSDVAPIRGLGDAMRVIRHPAFARRAVRCRPVSGLGKRGPCDSSLPANRSRDVQQQWVQFWGRSHMGRVMGPRAGSQPSVRFRDRGRGGQIFEPADLILDAGYHPDRTELDVGADLSRLGAPGRAPTINRQPQSGPPL